jgi:hypothetical protein
MGNRKSDLRVAFFCPGTLMLRLSLQGRSDFVRRPSESWNTVLSALLNTKVAR